MEHFDQYLDRENLAFQEPNGRYPAIVVSNLVVVTMAALRAMLGQELRPDTSLRLLRVYILKERRFYNFDWSIDLGRVAGEATAILDRLAAVAPDTYARRHAMAPSISFMPSEEGWMRYEHDPLKLRPAKST